MNNNMRNYNNFFSTHITTDSGISLSEKIIVDVIREGSWIHDSINLDEIYSTDIYDLFRQIKLLNVKTYEKHNTEILSINEDTIILKLIYSYLDKHIYNMLSTDNSYMKSLMSCKLPNVKDISSDIVEYLNVIILQEYKDMINNTFNTRDLEHHDIIFLINRISIIVDKILTSKYRITKPTCNDIKSILNYMVKQTCKLIINYDDQIPEKYERITRDEPIFSVVDSDCMSKIWRLINIIFYVIGKDIYQITNDYITSTNIDVLLNDININFIPDNQSPEIKEENDTKIEVIVYILNNCVYCEKTKKYFEDKDSIYSVSYIQVNDKEDAKSKIPEVVMNDTRINNKITNLTFPVIIMNSQYIGGYSDLKQDLSNTQSCKIYNRPDTDKTCTHLNSGFMQFQTLLYDLVSDSQIINNRQGNAINREITKKILEQMDKTKGKTRDTITKEFITSQIFNTDNDRAKLKVILKFIQHYGKSVMSSAYGCNHDFGDKDAAIKAWKQNENVFFSNLGMSTQQAIDVITSNKQLNNIREKFKQGLNTIDTSRINFIWKQCNEMFNEYEINTFGKILYSPIHKEILRSGDTNTDIINILDFFNTIDEDFKLNNLLWVIDTIAEWQLQLTKNVLNTDNTIVDIDAATTIKDDKITKIDIDMNNIINDTCSFPNCIKLGVYKFIKQKMNDKYSVIINDNNIGDFNINDKLSVTKILNTIKFILKMPVNESFYRSNTNDYVNIDSLSNRLSNDEIKLLLFHLKAAGDQSTIDAINYITENNISNEDWNYLTILSTGDLLAYQMCVSDGSSAVFKSANKIKISIQNMQLSNDTVTPVVNIFVTKCNSYMFIINKLKDVYLEIDTYINTMSTYSQAMFIQAYVILKQFKIYMLKLEKVYNLILDIFNYMNEDSIDYINLFSKLTVFNSNNFELIEFYDKIMAIDESYNFKLGVNNDEPYIICEYDDISMNELSINKGLPVSTFCDNNELKELCLDGKLKDSCPIETTQSQSEIANGVCSKLYLNNPNKYKSILHRENTTDYIQKACETSNDKNQCINDYIMNTLEPIFVKNKKSVMMKNTNRSIYIDPSLLVFGYAVFEDTGFIASIQGSYGIKKIDTVNLSILYKNAVTLSLQELFTPLGLFHLAHTIESGVTTIPKNELLSLTYLVKSIQFNIENMFIKLENNIINNKNIIVMIIKNVFLGFLNEQVISDIDEEGKDIEEVIHNKGRRINKNIISISNKTLTDKEILINVKSILPNDSDIERFISDVFEWSEDIETKPIIKYTSPNKTKNIKFVDLLFDSFFDFETLRNNTRSHLINIYTKSNNNIFFNNEINWNLYILNTKPTNPTSKVYEQAKKKVNKRRNNDKFLRRSERLRTLRRSERLKEKEKQK